MTNIVKIPLLNPLPFYNPNLVVDPKYNTRSFDEKVAESVCQYEIKRTRHDTSVPLQILSDFTDISLDFYVSRTGLFAINVPFTAIGVPITGATFKGYEAVIDFSDFDEDWYFGEITWTDQDVKQTRRTPNIDVKDEHPDTVLIEYRNATNDKGVIFDTGITFNFRIEGMIKNYQPSSSDEDYIDQKYNSISLSSIPYRIFDFLIGQDFVFRFPDWVIQLQNLIFSVNLKQIEGTYYNKADGAKFEMSRPDGVKDDRGYSKITIIEDTNIDLQIYKTGDQPTGDLIVIRRSDPVLKNVSTDQSISGKFTDNCTLCYLALWNYGFDNFTIIVGTEADGSDEIKRFEITGDDLTNFLEIGYVFDSPKTLYLTGLAGTNLKIYPVWDKLDAPVLNPVTSTGGYMPRTLYSYKEDTPGDVDNDWIIATGLGAADTQFEGCAICDGRNGTDDMTDHTLVMWDRTLPDMLNTSIGSNTTTITREFLPNEGIFTVRDIANNTNDDKPTPTSYVADTSNNGGLGYELHRSNLAPNVGLSAPLGDGAEMPIQPLSFVTFYFIKLPV